MFAIYAPKKYIAQTIGWGKKEVIKNLIEVDKERVFNTRFNYFLCSLRTPLNFPSDF